MRRFALLVLVLACCGVGEAGGELRLAALFGDHMVLQREMPVPVWGWAAPAEQVTVAFAGQRVAATADAHGRWRVELAPLRAGGPHTLTVSARHTLRIRDVLVGEVWLCSGQSNMEWPVRASLEAKAEIATARHPKLRHVKLPRNPQGAPAEDVTAPWEVCSPETVGTFTACGYFMARTLQRTLRVPVGLVHASWGGTRIEPWIAPAGLRGVPALADLARDVEATAGRPAAGAQQTAALFHGMVHPCVGYALRGAIWYQGESNHTEGALYTEKQKALIAGWRELWGLGDFPFYFVQIAPFRYGNEDPGVLPVFWEAQAAVLEAVPNTGMVVTNDIATVDNIHPPDKQHVGERLAYLALHRTYGRDVVDTGPTLERLETEGKTLRLTFRDTAGGLRSRDRKPLTHFEIAGAQTGFVPAAAVLVRDTIVLTSDAVDAPLAMRFAWHKLAAPNLTGGTGLPVGAFRSGRPPRPDFLPVVAEARDYTLVYDLDLERLARAPTYDVEDLAAARPGFDRVAYLLELAPAQGPARYLWVSLDAFTDDPAKLAIPTAASGARFQTAVQDLHVASNVPGLEAAAGAAGHLEAWPSNYGPACGAGVEGASATLWDIDDTPAGTDEGYGCLQLHDRRTRQTLFAINHWSAGGSGADIGIGPSEADPRSRDWTFAANGGSYTSKRLRVFVRRR